MRLNEWVCRGCRRKDLTVARDAGQKPGAMHSFMAGTNLFVVAQKGLFVLGLSNTKLETPALLGELSGGQFKNPRAIGVQFRYAFVTDGEGFKTVDISDPARPKLVPGATVPLKNARRFYLARTYASVADGADGLAFIDITNPEKPKLERLYNAGGALNDTRAVQIGSISASMFALVADGTLYQVEDVFTRDGQLATRDGTKQPPTEPFKALPEALLPPPDRDRLLRRGP
jgi:hypothetical protein